MKFLSKGNLEERHRLVILTDMENEADDSQTMVKLLMYSNEIDIEGLIAVTSRWLQEVPFPESIYDRVKAYGIVRPNLMKHSSGWPTEEYLLSKVAGGQKGYGMDGVGAGKSSEGSELIIKAIDKDDPRPIWFAINAGSNTLAQALWEVRETRTSEEVQKFVSKIRVYDDSGQDNSGAWICHEFPDLFYIRSKAQVFGLYGPHLGTGPQPWEPMDQYDWAEINIRTRHGILGALYPQRLFKKEKFNFMEGGGTTTWIGLVNKGLFVPEQITWGGWGGRFSWEKEQVFAGQFEVDKEEVQFEPFLMYPEAEDYSFEWEEDGEWTAFSGLHGTKKYNYRTFAPLWRWRTAFVNDFKARMDWCVGDYANVNHNPVVNFMGDENRSVIYLSAEVGESFELDASESYDPDNMIKKKFKNEVLNYNWFIYPEAGTYKGQVELVNEKSGIVTVNIPLDSSKKQIHLILEVTDNDHETPLTSYRRIVIDIE